MKLIIRADDVGYTKTHNLGTWKTIEEGITTSCDLMLDTPGFEDACEYLKRKPWISIGWHTHFWGHCVSDPKDVPSMVNENGRFRFRHDREALMNIDYEEALKECTAQIERCAKLLGRIPDTWSMGGFVNPLNEAIRTVCVHYGIAFDFLQGTGYDSKPLHCKEEYIPLNIYEYTAKNSRFIKSLKVQDCDSYFPADALMDIQIDDTRTYMFSRHPGFLDDYVEAESSVTLPRVKDVSALCDPRLRKFIRENHIELVNHRDALYGTHEYQDHLKAAGSDLAIPL